MALKYSLVLRRDMSKAAQSGDKLYYGQVRSTDRVSMKELCDLIASRSTASSGDIKLVIDGLINVLKDNLAKGCIVEMGEFGNFRMNAGSTGSFDEKSFDTRQFKKAKIIFSPGAELRKICAAPSFEKLTFVPGTSPDDDDLSQE